MLQLKGETKKPQWDFSEAGLNSRFIFTALFLSGGPGFKVLNW
jgi:hypothetical protein